MPFWFPGVLIGPVSLPSDAEQLDVVVADRRVDDEVDLAFLLQATVSTRGGSRRASRGCDCGNGLVECCWFERRLDRRQRLLERRFDDSTVPVSCIVRLKGCSDFECSRGDTLGSAVLVYSDGIQILAVVP